MRWLALSLAAWSALPLTAQVRIGATAGLISQTEGAVRVEAAPGKTQQLRAGASVRSGAGGRAEILLNACAVLHLGDHSAVRMVATALTDTRVELLSGAMMIQADRIVPETKVTILVRGASATVAKPGLYRFD